MIFYMYDTCILGHWVASGGASRAARQGVGRSGLAGWQSTPLTWITFDWVQYTITVMRLLTGAPPSPEDRDRATVKIASIVLTGLLLCASLAGVSFPLFALLTGEGGQVTTAEIVYAVIGGLATLILATFIIRSLRRRRGRKKTRIGKVQWRFPESS